MRRILFSWVLTLSFVFASGSNTLFAESLSLTDAVALGIKNATGIKVSGYLPQISEQVVKVEKGKFIPRIKVDVTKTYDRTRSPSIVLSNVQHTFGLSAGITGKLEWGTKYSLSWEYEKFSGDSPFLLISPYHLTELKLSLSQPLLKGGGSEVQKSWIRTAEAEQRAAYQRYTFVVMDTVMNTIDRYYEVCYRKAVLRGAEFALNLSTSVLDEVKLRIEEGMLPRVDIYEAEADLSRRETELETAKAGYRKALEQLWFLLGGNTEAEPSECNPEIERSPLTTENYIKIAHERRPDVLKLKEELKSKEVMVGFYRNALLPELDITTSVGVGGVAESRGEALDLLREGSARNWAVGVSFSVPLEREVDKARYRKAVLEKEKVETSLNDTLKKIELELKEVILDYELSLKRIETAGKLREATEKRYQAGREMFAQGMLGINDLFRYQKEYIDATISEEKAVLDSARAYYRLQRVSGLLLDAFGIKLIN